MLRVRYANVSDAKILGEIHSKSWKVAYKGIVPDEILENITVEKRQKYFEEALSNGLEEDALIFKNNEYVGFICIDAKIQIKRVIAVKYGDYIYYQNIGIWE